MLYCNTHNKSPITNLTSTQASSCMVMIAYQPSNHYWHQLISWIHVNVKNDSKFQWNGTTRGKRHGVNYGIHWICMLLEMVLNPCQMYLWRLHEAPNHQFATIWARLNCPKHLGQFDTICCCHFSVKICPKQNCLQYPKDISDFLLWYFEYCQI